MDFIKIIKDRGFVHQMTDEEGLRALLASGPQRAYIGFDCTAKSLHVGSLLQIMLLRWWQKCGHKPIVLLGGGTTKIGDPSGKDESRPPLNDAQIQENMDSLKQVFTQFIEFADDKAIMVNNDDWLKDLNYAQFLREYGRHFSINRMLTMDSVKLRLEREQTLSFLEFNYMILQAYDFVELYRLYACRVQLGGSDQWGNIINGVELQRRLLPQINTPENASIREDIKAAIKEVEINKDKHLFGITSPLLTTASGAKMGKTAAGAVWLNADLLSPYDYWQFWRNTEDADVVRFLKLFTELSLEEIAELGAAEGAGINQAKIRLATEATALLHGREEAEKAAKTAADTFGGSGASADLITFYFWPNEMENHPLYGLIKFLGLAESGGEARKLIRGNGVRIDDIVTNDENFKFTPESFVKNGFVKLSIGKKRHILLKLHEKV